MAARNTDDSYGWVAKLFHWGIALLIIGMLIVGFIMADMELSPDKFKIIGIHKSIGITILFLAALRLVWRLRNAVPKLPGHMDLISRFLAHSSHWMLYVLMFAMPLSGWLMSSASGFSVSVFGLFTLPNMVSPDKELSHQLWQVHSVIAWCIVGLVSLHALAALLHHFYYKDNILRRMIPFTKSGDTYAHTHDTTGC